MAEQTAFKTAFKTTLNSLLSDFNGDGFKYKNVFMSNEEFKKKLGEELEKELEKKYQDKYNSLEQRLKSELDAEKQRMQAELEAERRRQADLDAQLQAEIQRMKSAHEAALKEYLQAMTQAKLQQGDSVSTQVLMETQKHLLNKALENNTALSAEIDGLKATVASQKTTIDTLMKDNNVAGDLTTQIEGLNKKNSELNDNITRLTSDNNVLTTKNNELNKEINDLKVKIDDLTAEISRLSTENANLTANTTSLNQDNDGLRTELQTLNANYNDCKTRNKDCLSEIVKHKITIQLLENNSRYKELYARQFLMSAVLRKRIQELSADHRNTQDALNDLNMKHVDSENKLTEQIKEMLKKIVEQSVQIQLYESQVKAPAPAPAPVPSQDTRYKELYAKCFVELTTLRKHMTQMESSFTTQQQVHTKINEALFEKHKTAIDKKLLEQKLLHEIQTSLLNNYYANKTPVATNIQYPNTNALLLHK